MIDRVDGVETSQELADRLAAWRALLAALPARVAAAEAEEAAASAEEERRRADLNAAGTELSRCRRGMPEDYSGAGVVLRAIDEDGEPLEGALLEATRIAFRRLDPTEQRRRHAELAAAVEAWRGALGAFEEAAVARSSAAHRTGELRAAGRHVPERIAEAERDLAAALEREAQQHSRLQKIRRLLGRST